MPDVTEAAEEAVTDDVRADVMAAFEKHEGTETQEAAAETETPAEPEKAEPETPEKAAGEAEVPESDPDEQTELSEQPSEAADAPVSWSDGAKTEWSQLPAAVQEAVIKREREIDEGGRRWSEEKRRYEETLAPVKAIAEAKGIDEHSGVQKLAAAQAYLDRDPGSAIQWLAQSYGVDLKQLADAPQQEAPRVDPAVKSLHGKVEQLEHYISNREYQEIETEIDDFSRERPHFQKVRTYMGHLLESGAAESMQDAYDQACWAVPEVREQLLADQKAEAERKARERGQTERSKRGAVSISGSPSTPPASTPKEYPDVRSAVEDAWNQHAG